MKQYLNKYKLTISILLLSFLATPNLSKAQAFTDAVIDSVTLVPVDFISFTAAREDKNILLKWTTGNEINNNFFSVQRSYDGTNFENIGKVNPSSSKQYYFTDLNATNSVLYYRIENIDKDGKTNYTNIITIKSVSAKAEDWNIYPNPVPNNVINIDTKSLGCGTYNLSLKTVKSETVFTTTVVVNNSNIITIQLPLNILKGLYILNINGIESKINSSKKIIIK